MARSVDARKWRAWRARIKRFEKAGRSVAEFCRQEGVSHASFYQWRKRLAAMSARDDDHAEAAGAGNAKAAGARNAKAAGLGNAKAVRAPKGEAAGGGKGKVVRARNGKAAGVGKDRPAGAGKERQVDGVEGFTPVRLVAAASVAVHLPGGTELRVPTCDPEVLRLVIDTLAHADAQRAGGVRC